MNRGKNLLSRSTQGFMAGFLVAALGYTLYDIMKDRETELLKEPFVLNVCYAPPFVFRLLELGRTI